MSNITTELQKQKEDLKKVQSDAVKQVLLLEQGDAQEDLRIANALGSNHSIARAQTEMGRKLELETLDQKFAGNVFTLEQIKDLAKKYNMRFLQSKYFCGTLDTEVIAKLKAFAKETNTEITTGNLQYGYYILAPEQCFSLEEVKKMRRDPDPALFYKIDDNSYRLIHQWGNDFNIFNRLEGFKWESRDNLGIYRFIKCLLLAFCILIPAYAILGPKWYIWVALGISFIVSCMLAGESSSTTDYPSGKFHDDKWRSNVIYE